MPADDVEELTAERRTVSRRQLVIGGAAAGAGAWVVPSVISFATPAAAASAPGPTGGGLTCGTPNACDGQPACGQPGSNCTATANVGTPGCTCTEAAVCAEAPMCGPAPGYSCPPGYVCQQGCCDEPRCFKICA